MTASLAQLVGQSLDGIERLETTVHLAGTLRRPTWQIESNLGPQLAQGVNRAMRQQWEQQVATLRASIGKQADRQLAQLARQRETARQELLARLGDSRQFVEQLAKRDGAKELSIPKLGMWPSLPQKANLVR